MQDQGARNGAQKSARQSARLDIGLKGASQRHKSKAQDLCGCKVRMHKLKMQNKSNCVSIGARQGAQ